jgi:hypothetical protein
METCQTLSAILSRRMLVGTCGGLALAVAASATAQECTCDDDGDWKRSGSVLSPNNNNDQIGIGLPPNALAAKLHVRTTDLTVATTLESEKRNALNVRSVEGNGIDSRSMKLFGVTARGGASGFGGGVRGIGLSGSPGVLGTVAPGSVGTGVLGQSDNGIGVRGISKSHPGVLGETEDPDEAGVFGTGSRIGVEGESRQGVGVSGISEQSTGVVGTSAGSIGVSGESTRDIGVFGSGPANAGVVGDGLVGVRGESDKEAGVFGKGAKQGVMGESDSGFGVLGKSNSVSLGVSVEGAGVEAFSETGPGLSVQSLSGNLIEGEGQIFGQIVFRVANSGDVFVKGMQVHSDARSKTGIAPVTKVLEKLDRIRPVSFQRAGGNSISDRVLPRRRIGVLAQEVEAVFPELVADWGTGDQIAVDYAGLTAVLLGAVRELQAENARLQAQLGALEQRVLLQQRR